MLACACSAATNAAEVTAATLTNDDVAYLTQLSLIRGHAKVGHELFAEGEVEAARSHGRHPRDELYAPLVTTFTARRTSGFATELDGLRQSMDRADESEALAYTTLTAAIARAEQALGSRPVQTATVVAVIINLLREAAAEYDEAFIDGKLSNAHEYQDAYGFTQIALTWAQDLGNSNDPQIRRVAQRISSELADLAVMWPALMPPNRVQTKAAQLLGAAARVEIAALDLATP